MTPQLAAAKALWRDLFALAALSDADNFLTAIEKAGAANQTTKWPLWIAFIVSYSRPFTSNDDMGKASDKAIPQHLRDLHRAFIHARNSVVGHTNPLETLEDGLQANQIILRKRGCSSDIVPHAIVPSDEEIPNAKELVRCLLKDFSERTAQGKQALMAKTKDLPDGDYQFSYPNLPM
jgi:hypothetical protein